MISTSDSLISAERAAHLAAIAETFKQNRIVNEQIESLMRAGIEKEEGVATRQLLLTAIALSMRAGLAAERADSHKQRWIAHQQIETLRRAKIEEEEALVKGQLIAAELEGLGYTATIQEGFCRP